MYCEGQIVKDLETGNPIVYLGMFDFSTKEKFDMHILWIDINGSVIKKDALNTQPYVKKESVEDEHGFIKFEDIILGALPNFGLLDIGENNNEIGKKYSDFLKEFKKQMEIEAK